MARIRTIKPEFGADEDLSELPAETHLLAALLLMHSDDEGYFKANPKLVKASCCPLREDSLNIHEQLQQLARIGYLALGTGEDSKRYGRICGFTKHQKINRPTASKISGLSIKWDNSPNTHGEISEPSPQEQGTGNREQGTGKDTSHACGARSKDPPDWFLEIKREYPKRTGGERWADALKACRARIREGYSPDELIAGVRRYAEFIRAKGDEGTEFVQQAATFFGTNKGFAEPWDLPRAAPSNGGSSSARLHRRLSERVAAKTDQGASCE